MNSELPALNVEHIPLSRVFRNGYHKFQIRVENPSRIKSAFLRYGFVDVFGRRDAALATQKLIGEDNALSVSIVLPDKQYAFIVYQFLIEDAEGKKHHHPEQNGRAKIFKVPMQNDDTAPEIRVIAPEANEKIPSKPLEVRFLVQDDESGIDPKSVRFLFNGADYSRAIMQTGNIFIFRTGETMPPGAYSIEFSVRDRAGNSAATPLRTLTVTAPDPHEFSEDNNESEWKGQGSLSYSYTSNLTSLQSDNDWNFKRFESNANKSASLQYSVIRAETKIDLGPVLITSAPAAPGTRPHKFSFALSHENFALYWGDVAPQISTYTLSTGILGVWGEYRSSKEAKAGDYYIKSGYGQIRQGYEPDGTGRAGEFYRNAVGGALGYHVLKELSVYAAGQQTRDLIDSVAGKDTLIGLKNESAETGFDLNVDKFKWKITGKYAISQNESIHGRRLQQTGYTLDLSNTYTIPGINVQTVANYVETSPNFLSLPGSSGSPDRRQTSLQFSRNFLENVLALSTRGTYSHDNLRRLRPETQYTYSTNNTVGITVSKWPNLNASNNVTLTESSGIGPVRRSTLTNNNTCGTSYTFRLLKFEQSLSGNFSFTDVVDRSTPESAGNSRTLGVTSNYRIQLFAWLTWQLSPAWNRNLSLKTGALSETHTWSSNLNLTFLKGKFTQGFNFVKTQSFNRASESADVFLQSTSYSYGTNIQISAGESLRFSLNATMNTSSSGRDMLALYPGNFTASFQLNMTL